MRRQRKAGLLLLAAGILLAGGAVRPALAQDLQNLPPGSAQLLQQYLQGRQTGGATSTISPVDQSRNQTNGTRGQGAGDLQGLGSSVGIEKQLLDEHMRQQQIQDLINKRNYCAGLLDSTREPVVRPTAPLNSPDTTGLPGTGNTQNFTLPASSSGPSPEEIRLRVETELSSTELDYCLRSKDYLEQFGYEVFDNANRGGAAFNGAVPDSYVLGIGDEIIAIFHGTNAKSVTTQVDREGRVILPDMRPIPAAGRTFGDFRRDVEARTASELLGTDVFISLGKVKSIGVIVAGEVKNPGLQQLTSMTTVLDALVAAGGVKKTGTLRHIQVLRGSDVINVDLYDLFFGRNGVNLTLREGDRIVVPVIGPTIALLGDVKRKGIYELIGSRAAVTMRDALNLGGGPLRPRGFSIIVERFDQSGIQTVEEVSVDQARASDGDVIHVLRARDNLLGGVSLEGHITVPGLRSLAAAPTLRDLIGDRNAFKREPYLLFGALVTTDPDTRAQTLRPVNLQRILDGQENAALRDKDRLIVLGADDIAFLVSDGVRQVVATGKYAGDCEGLKNLSRLVSDTRSDRFVAAIRSIILEGGQTEPAVVKCPPLYDKNPELLGFVLEHIVSVNGEVQNPGVYPITDHTDLRSIIAVAGGLTNRADRTKIEFMQSLKDTEQGTATLERHVLNLATTEETALLVDPGSIIRFNSLLSDQERGAVELAGEFVRPGLYTITKGEHLSDLVERAGGLTPQAYPYAAVFTRQSVRKSQEDGFRRSARELTTALASAVLAGEADPSSLNAVRDISLQLQQTEAVGRMVIEADPAVLRVRKDLDTVLEPGDRIIMPKRPNFVSVVGDVLNPGSLQFVPGKAVKEYLAEAGGLQRSADKKRVFVVYPNGAAEPAPIGAWSFSSTLVPPGSTIVAPKNATPINTLRLATSITQILSQLAVSAASIAVITR